MADTIWEKEKVFETEMDATIAPLLKRVSMFLEDENWEKADEYCEKVLDQDPENGQAYLGKLMVEKHVSKLEELADCNESFENSLNYQKTVRFGGDRIASILNDYNSRIKERNENARIENIYNEAMAVMKSANSEEAFRTAAERFQMVPGFNAADSLAEQCLIRAEAFRERQSVEKEKANKKKKKSIVIISAILAACIVIATLLILIILPTIKKSTYIKKHGQKTYELFGIVEKGKTITFGSYEQDNDFTNGAEPIEWTVLEVTGNKALVISKYVLDNQPFNETAPTVSLGSGQSGPDITWKNCDIREWLNNSFFNETFNSDVQSAILETKLSSSHDVDGDIVTKNTKDKVFFLSHEEADAYFNTKTTRRALGTYYCRSSATFMTDDGYCWWWLRDTITIGAKADAVRSYGDYWAPRVDDKEGIRPAMWISLKDGSSKPSDNLVEVESDVPIVPETTTQEETTTEFIGGGPHAPDIYVSIVDELMVRTGPGTEYEAFAKLSKGDEFSSLESVNGWAHGYYNDREAWVSEQYLTSWPPGTGNYSDFEKAIEQFDPMHLSGAVGPYSIEYRGLDNTYVYFQAYAGGGWECVKVTQASQTNPYTVEYMSDAEKAQYEQKPY